MLNVLFLARKGRDVYVQCASNAIVDMLLRTQGVECPKHSSSVTGISKKIYAVVCVCTALWWFHARDDSSSCQLLKFWQELKYITAFARNPGDQLGLGGQQGSPPRKHGLCCTLGFMAVLWAGHPIFSGLSNVLPVWCSLIKCYFAFLPLTGVLHCACHAVDNVLPCSSFHCLWILDETNLSTALIQKMSCSS